MSLDKDNKVIVKIFGEDYPITGVSDTAHISKVADYVDTKMNDIAKTSRIQSRDKLAILTSLSIASELHEKADIVSQGDQQYNQQLDSMIARLDNALRT
ncbi:MAG: cell division protein ZapA [candidate division Zixibacteria bacterium]|nr:cell division protein ZapA [candidate division Zixibacteria bacterium]